jgi:hypothetical protein
VHKTKASRLSDRYIGFDRETQRRRALATSQLIPQAARYLKSALRTAADFGRGRRREDFEPIRFAVCVEDERKIFSNGVDWRSIRFDIGGGGGFPSQDAQQSVTTTGGEVRSQTGSAYRSTPREEGVYYCLPIRTESTNTR